MSRGTESVVGRVVLMNSWQTSLILQQCFSSRFPVWTGCVGLTGTVRKEPGPSRATVWHQLGDRVDCLRATGSV